MADAMQTSEAIRALQEAQVKLSQAIAGIAAHNQNPKAHPILERQIYDLMHGEQVFSRAQVRTIAQEILKEHTDKTAQEAHSGLTDALSEITKRLTKLEADVARIEDKVGGTTNSTMSKLERALQKIEDDYAPILTSLQTTLNEAENIGDRVLADSLKAQISETLSQKKAQILNAIEAWSIEMRT